MGAPSTSSVPVGSLALASAVIIGRALFPSSSAPATIMAPPRFALCLSGDLRIFSGTALLLEQRLISPTIAGGGAVDSFVHIWRGHASSGFGRGQTKKQGLAGERAARSLPGLKGLVIEDFEQWWPLTNDFYNFSHAKTVDAGGMGPRRWSKQFGSQWRKVFVAFRLAARHAATQSASPITYYAAMVRIRTDHFVVRPTNLAALHLSLSERARGREWYAWPECNPGLAFMATPVDAMFIATPLVAAALSSPPDAQAAYLRFCGGNEAFVAYRLFCLGLQPAPRLTGTCPGLTDNMFKSHTLSPSASAPLFFHLPPMGVTHVHSAEDLMRGIGIQTGLHPQLLYDGVVCVDPAFACAFLAGGDHEAWSAPLQLASDYCMRVRRSDPRKKLLSRRKAAAAKTSQLVCLRAASTPRVNVSIQHWRQAWSVLEEISNGATEAIPTCGPSGTRVPLGESGSMDCEAIKASHAAGILRFEAKAGKKGSKGKGKRASTDADADASAAQRSWLSPHLCPPRRQSLLDANLPGVCLPGDARGVHEPRLHGYFEAGNDRSSSKLA